MAEGFDDGVWLVELASLSDPDLVPQALAVVLSVSEMPGIPLVDLLLAHLRAREVLLVLDNCEHLLDASPSLVGTLLRSCQGLSVLATCREALGVEGKILFAVPPDDATTRSGEQGRERSRDRSREPAGRREGDAEGEDVAAHPEVPLQHVLGAEVDPEIERKFWKAWVLPGRSRVPAPGVRFYNPRLGNREKAIVIWLKGESYERLVVEVEDPGAIVAMINKAVEA